MMDGYHKIAVKNVCIVDICFRRQGELYNEGRIVVDVDTYDFAGHITDDVIIGFYRDGKYKIHYYYKTYDLDVNPITGIIEEPEVLCQEYDIYLESKLEKTSIAQDFVNQMLIFECEQDLYMLSFEYVVDDMQEIQKVLNNTADLLMQRN